MMKSLKLITFFIAILGLSCFSKSEAQIPNAVKEAFASKYPGEKGYDWEKDSHGNIEIQFKRNGEQYRADFTKDGRWIETEVSIKAKELPIAILKRIENDFGDREINEVELVEHATKGKFYDVEFKRKGKNLDVEFREDGTILNGK
ncbi:PepSY-like domain-containing protein [Winogradskyella maritima]|uniref:PepSY-like domain-containing protein n=1 Tax=Winogradskyella maritima TaxID=1517766 RepID=A0ABV8ADD3_9FLAO|nr:PepSY-like domain-containing protein [Winogradskyella maritima]